MLFFLRMFRKNFVVIYHFSLEPSSGNNKAEHGSEKPKASKIALFSSKENIFYLFLSTLYQKIS